MGNLSEIISALGGRVANFVRGGTGALLRVLLACTALSACGRSTQMMDGGTGADQVDGVPDGNYYILILIDVDRSGGSSPTPGDYYSWCNGNDVGNPPAEPNVFAYNSNSNRFDCLLVTR